MIIGWIADPVGDSTMGSGKTLGMTDRIKKQLETGQASKCRTNYGALCETTPLMPGALTEEAQDLENEIVAIDEIHVFIDSRRPGSKRNLSFGYVATQTRKKNVYLHYSSQTWDQVDKRLRKNTDRIVYCRKIAKDVFLYRVYNPKTWRLIARYCLDGSKVYGLYDTRKVITDISVDEEKPKKTSKKTAKKEQEEEAECAVCGLMFGGKGAMDACARHVVTDHSPNTFHTRLDLSKVA